MTKVDAPAALWPVRWNINGRTGIRNLRFHTCDIQKRPKPPGPSGRFSMRSSWRNCTAVAKAVHEVAKAPGARAYLITHTMPAGYDDHQRRDHWNEFLNRFRQEAPLAYVWVTERHKAPATAGMVHHHMVCVFPGIWWYSKRVKGWSLRYSRSVNGLDVRPITRSGAAYVTKYVVKGCAWSLPNALPQDTRDDGTLPFRWWGSSAIPRNGEVLVRRDELDHLDMRVPWFNHEWVWTSTRNTAAWSAALVLQRFYWRWCAEGPDPGRALNAQASGAGGVAIHGNVV